MGEAAQMETGEVFLQKNYDCETSIGIPRPHRKQLFELDP